MPLFFVATVIAWEKDDPKEVSTDFLLTLKFDPDRFMRWPSLHYLLIRVDRHRMSLFQLYVYVNQPENET